MATKFFVLFIFIVSVVALLALYLIKIAFNFMYLRLRDKKAAGSLGDFFSRKFIHKGDDQRWRDAFLALPLLFGIEIDEDDDAVNTIKHTIKKVHVAIYSVLIMAMLVGVYASKAYPEGIF